MKPRLQGTAASIEDGVWRAADAELTTQIHGLFTRCPDLDGFSVQAKVRAEGNTSDDDELFVTAIGIGPLAARERYADIFEDIATTLKNLLEERPEAAALLRGRTFARVVH
ncbi:MAG TPA: hypothetical protein VG873_14745 [Burkholderiales bacterium]|nr:hypothetical protein [Burkholderiales bacterium]